MQINGLNFEYESFEFGYESAETGNASSEFEWVRNDRGYESTGFPVFISLSDHPQDYSSSIPNSTAPFGIQLIMEPIVVIIVLDVSYASKYTLQKSLLQNLNVITKHNQPTSNYILKELYIVADVMCYK